MSTQNPGSPPPDGDPLDAQSRIEQLKRQVEELEQIRHLEDQVQQLQQPSPAGSTTASSPASTPAPDQAAAPPATTSALAAPAQKGRTGILVGLVAALLVLGGGGYAAFVNPGFVASEDDSAQDIVLVGAHDQQDDPFSEVPVATAVDDAALEADAGAPAQPGAAAVSGNTPGLYGGSMNESYCDVDQLITFLNENPDKAAAWVSAITSDPEAKLTDGRPLTLDLLPTYIRSLTPVVLTADTRVTNHGFSAGKPVAWQSVLQRGTSALVDSRGVLRTRCWCGNPLAPAKTVKGTPTYTGTRWNGFDPHQVQAVTPSSQIITSFALASLQGGHGITRPSGSSGVLDNKLPPGATATTQTASGLVKAQHPQSQLTVVVPSGQKVTYDRADDGSPRLNFGYQAPKPNDRQFVFEAGAGATIRDYGTDAAGRDAYINEAKRIRQESGYSAACKASKFIEKPITLGVLKGTMITAPACAAAPSAGTAQWGVAFPATYFSLTGINGEAIAAYAFPDGLSAAMTALSSARFK